MGALPRAKGTMVAATQATSTGTTGVSVPVMPSTRSAPVKGARTTAVKNAAMPTIAPKVGESARPGTALWARLREEGADHGADHQQWRKQAAGGARRVGERTEQPAGDKDDRQRRQRQRRIEDGLDERIATADQPRFEPGDQPNHSAHCRGAEWSRNRRERGKPIEGEEDRPVVGRAERPQQHAEQEAGGDGHAGRLRRWRDHEVERVTEDGARHQHRRRTRGQGGHHEFGAEPTRQFLEDESDPTERGVERHRQTGPGGRALDDAHARVVQGASLRHTRPDGGPHLDSGAFAAKRQPGADGEYAPNKLDREHGDRGGGGFPTHHGLHMLHAAAGGEGRETLYQPGRYRHEDRGDRHRNHPADRGPLPRPAEERVSERLGP